MNEALLPTEHRQAAGRGRPFFGLIEAVLVDGPPPSAASGAIARDDAEAAWTWMLRDLASDLIAPETPDSPQSAEALHYLMPELLQRARGALAGASTSAEAERRIRVQLGSESAWARLPVMLSALRCRTALEKAAALGRAISSIEDPGQLRLALEALPQDDREAFPLLVHAMLGEMASPARLVAVLVEIAGGATEADIRSAGLGPVVDALLAQAQNQLGAVRETGPFADIDAVCRAVDRFHRLVRGINLHLELNRDGQWLRALARLTKAISDPLAPRLTDLVPEINRALRRREADRLDSDTLLSALNGCYVLATVRACRDSLAVNAAFEESWMRAGEALEVHLERLRERANEAPDDPHAAARLDAAITMAELRFGRDYADVLRRARDFRISATRTATAPPASRT